MSCSRSPSRRSPVHDREGQALDVFKTGAPPNPTDRRQDGPEPLRQRFSCARTAVFAVVSSAAVAFGGCSSGDISGTETSDANPNAPDADPSAPDAAVLDAAPGAPDATAGIPDAWTPPPDAIPPECTPTGGECGAGRDCLAGVCRDECAFGFWCDENTPSGAYCQEGLCVECAMDSNCPGTRYRCDSTSHLCVDEPFDPTLTKIGIFYHTWHCPASEEVHDITKILAGEAEYGPYYSSHWWGEPAEGYYCLSENDPLLAQHAQQLHDMGVDFVFVDVTNHAYNSNALNDRPVEMILEPFARMVAVWGAMPDAPRIVPWVPVVVSDATHPDSVQMVYTLLDMLDDYPGLQFEYQGKPLILVTENDSYPVDEGKIAALSATYTIRKMWAFEAEGTAKWSFIEKCDESPLEPPRCDQRMSTWNGDIEQLAITTAYGANYMSHTDTATPKYQGKTFRKQFETLIDNPEVPIATITGWNEWNVGRLPCGEAYLCDCANPQDQLGCFLDQYTIDYNRDIEPTATAMGDYYYRLATACIALFRSGGRCDAAHADNLCCKDYEAAPSE